MRNTRRFPRPSYQLYIGVVIGLMCSLCLNEIFRGSTTIRKVSVSENLSEFIFKRDTVLRPPSGNGPLGKNVRVLCWVQTSPKNHYTKAIHVKRTWGKRCDKLLMVSSQKDSVIDSIAIPGSGSGRDWLWGRAKGALKYAWEHHRDEFDWIMKADEDTYVIVENLKKFLSNYSSSDPIFFGCQYSRSDIPSWVSGGSGYVLSKEALRRFVLDGLPNPDKCKKSNKGSEDVSVSNCLIRVGVTLKDSRDSSGRHRFLVLNPKTHLFPRTLTDSDTKIWYFKQLVYPQVQGMDCCASDAISFHYLDPKEMYVLEYFLYHIRPEGVDREQEYVQEYPLEFSPLNTTRTYSKWGGHSNASINDLK